MSVYSFQARERGEVYFVFWNTIRFILHRETEAICALRKKPGKTDLWLSCYIETWEFGCSFPLCVAWGRSGRRQNQQSREQPNPKWGCGDCFGAAARAELSRLGSTSSRSSKCNLAGLSPARIPSSALAFPCGWSAATWPDGIRAALQWDKPKTWSLDRLQCGLIGVARKDNESRAKSSP